MEKDNLVKIKVKKRHIYLLLIVLVLALVFLFVMTQTKITNNSIGADNVEALSMRFSILSNANTNSCGGTFNYVDSMPESARIQGSCCSSMDFHRYVEQIEGLEKYSEYDIIPPDPYDVPVSGAKELLGYQKTIELNEEQQAIYDKATDVSHEKGPCCCKCWHWYAYEGLAKYLIVEEGFNAEQIAEVWDLSDACGGSGHIEGGGGH